MAGHSRRQFLQTSAALFAASFLLPGSAAGQKKRLLSFSTLGCPDWDFQKIVDFAASHGYHGLEIRGIQRQLDLPKCPEFSTAENRTRTAMVMKNKNLRFVGLGSSANLHFADGDEKQKNMDEAKRFIDLAGQIDCPYVRVFPNKFPEGLEKNAVIEIISSNLRSLGEYAKDSGVSVLMETHGDVVRINDLEKIMQLAQHDHTGLVWDICNMWTVTKEPPADAYRRLKKYIRHTHIKDAKLVDGKPQYTLLGKGEVPILEAIDILDSGDYGGYYSFEWEKMWHPSIAEPEIAFADYAKVMKEHFD